MRTEKSGQRREGAKDGCGGGGGRGGGAGGPTLRCKWTCGCGQPLWVTEC